MAQLVRWMRPLWISHSRAAHWPSETHSGHADAMASGRHLLSISGEPGPRSDAADSSVLKKTVYAN